jgi:hypothetical protein
MSARRRAPERIGSRILILAIGVVLAGCASSKPNPSSGSQAGKGFRTLEAVVVDRTYDPPGSGGTSFGSSGAYYLAFEAQDGGATAHFRFPVTRTQYQRFVEGTHVELVLADDRLREIRPLP